MRINFNEVADNEIKVSKTVKPGVAVFTIVSAECKTNVNNNAYIRFEFQNKDEQKFRQDFYINNDKGLGRVKELAKNSNVELGDVDVDTLMARFIGKEVGLIVDGQKEYAEIEGQQRVVTRATLKFAKFSFQPSTLAEFVNSPIKMDESRILPVNATAELTTADPAAAKSDLPF
jgi:hypothetical protein